MFLEALNLQFAYKQFAPHPLFANEPQLTDVDQCRPRSRPTISF